MAFNSTIQNLEIADNLETVLTLLQDIAPTNQRVTEQLGNIRIPILADFPQLICYSLIGWGNIL